MSDYTKPDKVSYLSRFIREHDYTILFNGLGALEARNLNWHPAPETDRTARIASFLSQHPFQIVRPESVWKAEIQIYPNKLTTLPIEFSSNQLTMDEKRMGLLNVLRRDPRLVASSRDTEKWNIDYQKDKSTWLQDAQTIINNACDKGTLHRGIQGNFVDLEVTKEEFLLTLDRRHFSNLNNIERERLGTTVVELFVTQMGSLPAVRFSSLCFWFSYTDTDKSFPMKYQGLDIGDYSQLALIPYCTTFTADTTMARVAKRALAERPAACKVYNPALFKAPLNS